MTISLIWAMDRNRIIGRDNKLPWHLPADLAFFRRTTNGHAVIMGRKTFESIGKPLPQRRNIVVTRNPDYRADGCETVRSLQEAIRAAGDEEAFVIGGAELYGAALPLADKLYVTRIDHEFEGDARFPEIPADEWRLVWSEPGPRDERNPYDYAFQLFERAKRSAE